MTFMIGSGFVSLVSAGTFIFCVSFGLLMRGLAKRR